MSNILLITIDSLRQDHLGCYGYSRDTTPHIDSIAARSHTFRNAIANACMTQMSFPMILTSSYASMYGGCERISEYRTVVSEVVKQNGYETAGFHSNLFLSSEFGYGRGFDTFYDSKTDPDLTTKIKQTVKDNLDHNGWLFGFLSDVLETAERQAGINVGSPYVNAEEITDKAVDWVESTGGSESPRFLWTHYMDVHHPYTPPKEHQLVFRDDPISEKTAIQLRRKMMNDPSSVTEAELGDIVDLYDAEIRFTDHEIGRLIDSVHSQWDEETTIIITSDHGEEFLEHGRFSHYSTFHEEVVRVPLIIDSNSGSEEHDELVALSDISPTIVDYADSTQPENFYGHSLNKVISGEDWERGHVIGEAVENGEITKLMFRDEMWKYVEEPNGERLYNLSTDSTETEDVSDFNAHSNELNRIRSAVEEHKQLSAENTAAVEKAEMDDEVKDRLRNLGYRE